MPWNLVQNHRLGAIPLEARMAIDWGTFLATLVPEVRAGISKTHQAVEHKKAVEKQDKLAQLGIQLQTAKDKRDRAAAQVAEIFARDERLRDYALKKGWLDLGYMQLMFPYLFEKKGAARGGGGGRKPADFSQWEARLEKDFLDDIIDAGFSLATRDEIQDLLRANRGDPYAVWSEIERIIRSTPLVGQENLTDEAIQNMRGLALNAANYFFNAYSQGPGGTKPEPPPAEEPPPPEYPEGYGPPGVIQPSTEKPTTAPVTPTKTVTPGGFRGVGLPAIGMAPSQIGTGLASPTRPTGEGTIEDTESFKAAEMASRYPVGNERAIAQIDAELNQQGFDVGERLRILNMYDSIINAR